MPNKRRTATRRIAAQ